MLGDYNPECGAWIRFNPLDGKGVKNDNVTEFRYALVESDKMDIAKQNEIIRTLELPVACLVHSGKSRCMLLLGSMQQTMRNIVNVLIIFTLFVRKTALKSILKTVILRGSAECRA